MFWLDSIYFTLFLIASEVLSGRYYRFSWPSCLKKEIKLQSVYIVQELI